MTTPYDEIALVDLPRGTDRSAFHREVADRIIEVWRARARRLGSDGDTIRSGPQLSTVAEMTAAIARAYNALPPARGAARSVDRLADPIALWVVAVSDLGGVARHVLDATRVGVPGWRIVVLCPEGPLAERLRAQGSAVLTTPINPANSLAGGLSAVRHAVRTLRPEVVHSHLAYSDFLVAGATVGLAVRLFTTEHGIARGDLVYHGTRWKSRMMETAHAARLRRFDALIAVSHATLDAVRSKWHPARGLRTVVIQNGVDARSNPTVPASGYFHVISLSRLAPEKGLFDLLEAYKLIHDEHPEARLTLAGEGPLRAQLERRVIQLGLEHTATMPGFVEPAQLLRTSHALAQLSTWENCSFALLDALSNQLGVVATDAGGNAELISGSLRETDPPFDYEPESGSASRPTIGARLIDFLNKVRFIWLYRVYPWESLYTVTDKSALIIRNNVDCPQLVKKFRATSAGRQGVACERAAHATLKNRPWKMSLIAIRGRSITMPMLPPSTRLDRAANMMSHAEALSVATQVLDIALEIFMTGHVHRDLSSRNIYLHDGKILINDFETWAPLSREVSFLTSYDITGIGPEHIEGRTGGAFGGRPGTLLQIDETLGVSLHDIVNALQKRVHESVIDGILTETEGRLKLQNLLI